MQHELQAYGTTCGRHANGMKCWHIGDRVVQQNTQNKARDLEKYLTPVKLPETTNR